MIYLIHNRGDIVKINKRGQALVEFVLILPVLLLLIFAFIDAGRIILCKNYLETSMSDVKTLIDEDKDLTYINNYINHDSDYKIKVSIINGEFTKVVLETKIDLITPGMNKIFNENIKVERSIIHE